MNDLDVGELKRREEMARYSAEREARIRNLADAVDMELRRRIGSKSHRGSRRAVVCLSDTDPVTGGHPVFRSATEAGHSVGRAPDNVCQAIRRRGECGGKLWDYLDRLRGGHEVQTDAGWFWVGVLMPRAGASAPRPQTDRTRTASPARKPVPLYRDPRRPWQLALWDMDKTLKRAPRPATVPACGVTEHGLSGRRLYPAGDGRVRTDPMVAAAQRN